MADLRRPKVAAQKGLFAASRAVVLALALALLDGCTGCVRPLYVTVTDENGDPAYPGRVTWALVDDDDQTDCDEIADLTERIGDRWWCGPGKWTYNRLGTYVIRAYSLGEVYVEMASVPEDGCDVQEDVEVVIPGGTFP